MVIFGYPCIFTPIYCKNKNSLETSGTHGEAFLHSIFTIISHGLDFDLHV